MLLVPTRRRISKLRNFLNSAIQAETTCPALLLVDESDWKDNEREYKTLEEFHMPNPLWRFHVTKSEGMGPKVREVWDEYVKGSPWVGILNDDHVIVTKHWDKRLIDQLTGKNFITTNDRWNAPLRAAGATMFSMPLMEQFGFPMFPLQVDHLGIDDVFEQIGRATGCWEVDMSVIVEHHHAFKNPDSVDETHTKVYGTTPWQNPQTGEMSPEAQRTQASFMVWYQKDLPGIVERVRQFRSQETVNDLPIKDSGNKNETVSVPT